MKIPEPFWAVVLAALGISLELSLLFAHGASDPTRHDVATAGFCLISGAIGAFKSAGNGVSSKAGNAE